MIFVKQTHSTSTLLREQYTESLPHLYTIRTDFQTAGRGQAGNSWESEEGKNLLFSTLLKYSNLLATEQWRLSMLVTVALWEVLAMYLPSNKLSIKWPNDIYYGDKKLVGILIENSLLGRYVDHSIAGIGINVNQTRWQSSAPNPISMKEITGEEYQVEELLDNWIKTVKKMEKYSTDKLSAVYLQHIYRKKGWYKYVDREVSVMPTAIASADTEEAFFAEFVGITQQGELVLRKENNKEQTYHFKQIRFVI